MPGKKQRHAVSKAQARFLGAVIAGKAHAPGLSKEEAKDMLRGVRVKKLPKQTQNKDND